MRRLNSRKRTVWSIALSKFREAHFAVFPEKLVETCLLAASPPGGLVLDPFLGSGTTALVAKRLGRDYVGIDCVGDYCRMARARCRNVEPARRDGSAGSHDRSVQASFSSFS